MHPAESRRAPGTHRGPLPPGHPLHVPDTALHRTAPHRCLTRAPGLALQGKASPPASPCALAAASSGVRPGPGVGQWSTANRLPEQRRRGTGAAPKEGEVTAHSAGPAPSREAAATDMDPRESKRDETCWQREKGCFMLQQRRRSGVFPVTSAQVKIIIRFFFCTHRCKTC